MKKPIVDILIEHQGGVTKDGERYILHYKTVERKDGKNYYHAHKKDVTYLTTEIEERWQDMEGSVSNTSWSEKAIGVERLFPPYHDLEEAKRWIFVSILQGILVKDVEPKTPVMIWVEKGDKGMIVSGVCDCFGGKKELKYRKIEY